MDSEPSTEQHRTLISLRNTVRVLAVLLLVLVVVEATPLLILLAKPNGPASLSSPTPSGVKSPSAVTVTRQPGGSVATSLGYGIVLNKESSVIREWIALHDPALPVDLVGTPGIATDYKAGGNFSSGEYEYQAKVTLDVKQPLSAVQINFLTFDIWGEHARTLNLTTLEDLPPGKRELGATWRLFSENEASEYYASIVYVARARTADGRVIAASTDAALEEAKKFSAKFTPADLEPPKAEKK